MKLLYVTDALAIHGGLERVLTEKANWLSSQQNYDVFLLTVNQGTHPLAFPLSPRVVFDDLNICFYQQYRYSALKRLWQRRRLHQKFRRLLAEKIGQTAPDVIICARLDYVKDLVKVKGNVPLVFESHSSRRASLIEGDGWLRRFHVWYLQQAVKKAQMVVALTEGDAEEWRKLIPKVRVAPDVVCLNDTGAYSDCKAKSVAFVGRFSKQKDIGSLLRIWMLVHHRYPDWHLHVYGGYGDEYEKWHAILQQSDCNITVHDTTADIMERYLEHSMLIMTSRYEPFGLVLPEAMSCGLPVIAFDCPYGPKSIVSDGVDGYLVEPGNIEEFSDKVCALIENPVLRGKIGQAGVQSSQRFRANVIMTCWKSLLDEILLKK